MATQAYTAPHPVQVGGVYYPAGEVFFWESTEIGKDDDGKAVMSKEGSDWEKVTAKEAAAITSSTDRVPDDADLESLTKAPLQAVAFMRHVQGIADLDAEGLKDAIRASYEPKL